MVRKPGDDLAPRPRSSFLRFGNRREAGRRLAEALLGIPDIATVDTPVVVLALPRGGVPVAYEVAKALGAPLDVLLVRKIGAPGHSEFGIGAIVEGTPPQVVLNEDLVRHVGASPRFLASEQAREIEEMERRRRLYRGGRGPPPLSGRTVILVDDGIATGSTVRAALLGIARSSPARLILAVPVAPPDTLAALEALADKVVCLLVPDHFMAVGSFYEDFDQTTDEEVLRLLQEADVSSRGGGAASPSQLRSSPVHR